MRFITIPEPIVLKDPITGEFFKILDKNVTQPTMLQLKEGAQQITVDDKKPKLFFWWLRTFVFQDEKFNAGWESWERITRLTQALENAEPGDIIPLDEEDWDLVSAVAKSPSKPCYQTGLIAAQYFTFIVGMAGTKDDPIPTKHPDDIAKELAETEAAAAKNEAKKLAEAAEELQEKAESSEAA